MPASRHVTKDFQRTKLLDFNDFKPDIPVPGIFDEPTRCYQINVEWASIVMGMVSWLTDPDLWGNDKDERFVAIQEISKFLQGMQCMNCQDVLACVNADASQIALQAMIFSQSESATQTHLDSLETLYDGTPQSVGASIPVIAPDATEQNALCYAMEQFVSLYAAAKLAKLQQKNLLSITWSRIQQFAIAVYNQSNSLIGFVLPTDLFGCFVSDTEAMTVLQNDAAISQVACCLVDSLKVVSLSETVFNNALVSCAASLTGDAHKIACILDNDNSLAVYIQFLEAYNIALNRQIAGDTLACNCVNPIYPNLVSTRCIDSFTAGTLTQLTANTWRCDSEFKAPGPNTYMVFEDDQQRTFEILVTSIVPAGNINNVRSYTFPCTDISRGNAASQLSNLPNTVSYYLSDTGNQPFTIEFVVSEVGT